MYSRESGIVTMKDKLEMNAANVFVMDSKAFTSYGRKLKKLTTALVREAAMKHERVMLNDFSVKQGSGPVFENLPEWGSGFESGAMLMFDGMLTPSERAINQIVAHDAAARFAEVGTCPAPVFIAMVLDKMQGLGVEKLDRFCDPGFCVAWEEDGGKHYFESMGAWASKHKGEPVYDALLSGELEYLCVFGDDGAKKSVVASFKWDGGFGEMP